MQVHEYELTPHANLAGWYRVVASTGAAVLWQAASGVAGLVAAVACLDALQCA